MVSNPQSKTERECKDIDYKQLLSVATELFVLFPTMLNPYFAATAALRQNQASEFGYSNADWRVSQSKLQLLRPENCLFFKSLEANHKY
jgi:hypothetical protein